MGAIFFPLFYLGGEERNGVFLKNRLFPGQTKFSVMDTIKKTWSFMLACGVSAK